MKFYVREDLYWRMVRQYALSVVMLVFCVFVIVSQAGTIKQQRVLIQSFQQDKGCMHDPRK